MEKIQFGSVLFCLLMLSIIAVATMGSIYDRKGIHSEIEEIRAFTKSAQDEAKMQREMLDARAIIQVTNVRANIKAGTITPEKVNRIRSLWQKAQYDRVAPLIEPNE